VQCQRAVCDWWNRDVLEVHEDALRRFGPEVSGAVVALDRPDRRFEHQVEWPGFGEIVHAAFRTFFARLNLIGAKTFLALPAVDQRVGERGFVAGVSQDGLVHQDRGIEAFHVVTLVDIGSPPRAFDIVLEFDAHGTVVPRPLQTSV